jgi:tight adherence protein C
MPLEAVVIALMGACSIFLLSYSFFPSRNPLALRIAAMEQVSERDHFERQARFEKIFGGETTGPLAARLIEAGWYQVTPAAFRLRGFAGFLLGAALALALAMAAPHKPQPLIAGVMIALLAWRMPKISLDRAIKARKAAFERTLPDFLDLLAATVCAGLSLNAALIQATEGVTGPVRDELESALAEIRLGRPRADALEAMAARVNDQQTTTMIAAIVQAERLGSNVTATFKELAADTRHLRWSLAEERAVRLPVKMMFPMGLLMLPSLYVMMLGPLAARLVQVFGRH